MERIKILDIHTHVFNGAYMPVEGYILSLFEKETEPKISETLRCAAWVGAKILTLRTPSKAKKKETNIEWVKFIENTNSFSDLIKDFSNRLANYYEEIKNKKKIEGHLYSDEEDIIKAVNWIVERNYLQCTRQDQHDLIYEKSIRESIVEFITWLMANVNLGESSFEIERKIRFVLLLAATRTKSLSEYLLETYSSEEKVEVLLFVHHLMDMEYGYKRLDCNDGPRIPIWASGQPSMPKIGYKKQVENLSKLSNNHKPGLIGFVAYDPRRPKALQIVNDAIFNKAYCGIKFYPAMGYTPEETSKIEEIVDDQHHNIFSYCCKHSLPMLVHCKPGAMEAKKGWDNLGKPENWVKVLEKYNDLRLCFGHAGGGVQKIEVAPSAGRLVHEYEYGWFSGNSEKWESQKFHFSKKIVSLCENYPNVYCDLSILSELLENRGMDEDFNLTSAKKSLQSTLEYLLGNFPNLKNKIMYGSDWHMPTVLGASADYLARFIEIFSTEILNSFSDLFFYKNAVCYLNLKRFLERNEKNNFISSSFYERLRNIADMA